MTANVREGGKDQHRDVRHSHPTHAADVAPPGCTRNILACKHEWHTRPLGWVNSCPPLLFKVREQPADRVVKPTLTPVHKGPDLQAALRMPRITINGYAEAMEKGTVLGYKGAEIG
eukprot:3626512-Prymnesium_polylepis.1